MQEKVNTLCFIPIRVSVQRTRFELTKTILQAVSSNGEELQDGDILAVSSKFVSMSEGRTVVLKEVVPGEEAHQLAQRFEMPENLAELVVREADVILGGVKGFALAIKNGVIAPNAGIDRSNVFPGGAILYPRDPYASADSLANKISSTTGRKIAVVLTDSRLMPTRIGTTGVAVSVSGFDPVRDERGRRDLFGNTLRVTRRAIADDIASGVQLLMGEADESVPVVIVRNSGIPIHQKPVDTRSLSIPSSECIFIAGISNAKTTPVERPRQ